MIRFGSHDDDDDDDDDVALDLQYLTSSVLLCPAGHRLSRPPPDPLGRATKPRLPHTATLGGRGDRRDAAVGLGERGRGKVPSWGRLARSPGKEGDPQEERGFHQFWMHFPPRIFWAPSFLSLHLDERRFFRGWNPHHVRQPH